jgi:hypothetical protein
MHVFILWHVHEMESGEEDSKLIGVYSTEQSAEAARQRSCRLPGFRDSPDAFTIDNYEVDTDHWTEGYATVYPDQNT